jgi:hypothetical protein
MAVRPLGRRNWQFLSVAGLDASRRPARLPVCGPSDLSRPRYSQSQPQSLWLDHVAIAIDAIRAYLRVAFGTVQTSGAFGSRGGGDRQTPDNDADHQRCDTDGASAHRAPPGRRAPLVLPSAEIGCLAGPEKGCGAPACPVLQCRSLLKPDACSFRGATLLAHRVRSALRFRRLEAATQKCHPVSSGATSKAASRS